MSWVARCPTLSKRYAMTRDAKLSEGNSDKVVMWTGGSYEYDDGIRALLLLDRPEIQLGTTLHKATPACDTRPNARTHPGAHLSVSSTGEEPFQVEEALWAIQEHECWEEGENTIARRWSRYLDFSSWTSNQSEIASRKSTFLKTCCKPDRRIDSRITVTLETT